MQSPPIGGIQMNRSGTWRAHLRRAGRMYECGTYPTRGEALGVLKQISAAINSGADIASAVERHALRQRSPRGSVNCRNVRGLPEKPDVVIRDEFAPSPLDLLIEHENRMFAVSLARRFPILSLEARGLTLPQISEMHGIRQIVLERLRKEEQQQARQRVLEREGACSQ